MLPFMRGAHLLTLFQDVFNDPFHGSACHRPPTDGCEIDGCPDNEAFPALITGPAREGRAVNLASLAGRVHSDVTVRVIGQRRVSSWEWPITSHRGSPHRPTQTQHLRHRGRGQHHNSSINSYIVHSRLEFREIFIQKYIYLFYYLLSILKCIVNILLKKYR